MPQPGGVPLRDWPVLRSVCPLCRVLVKMDMTLQVKQPFTGIAFVKLQASIDYDQQDKVESHLRGKYVRRAETRARQTPNQRYHSNVVWNDLVPSL